MARMSREHYESLSEDAQYLVDNAKKVGIRPALLGKHFTDEDGIVYEVAGARGSLVLCTLVKGPKGTEEEWLADSKTVKQDARRTRRAEGSGEESGGRRRRSKRTEQPAEEEAPQGRRRGRPRKEEPSVEAPTGGHAVVIRGDVLTITDNVLHLEGATVLTQRAIALRVSKEQADALRDFGIPTQEA